MKGITFGSWYPSDGDVISAVEIDMKSTCMNVDNAVVFCSLEETVISYMHYLFNNAVGMTLGY